MEHSISNVLAERYATPAMKSIWSSEGKIVLEREFWIAVMRAQKDLGIDIPSEAIEAYEKVKNVVNLDAIMERERVSRHDVKARIEEFCGLAGHEHIHKGMTSRDLTENVEQLQVWKSLQEIHFKTLATLGQFAEKADEFRDQPITARTHNVAAQVTTLGKRLSTFGEELIIASEHLNHLLSSYRVRGLKGAVGTQLDQISLFGGDPAKAIALEERVVTHLGIPNTSTCVGQVYPRSLDFEVISSLNQLASGPANFARTLRLMAGHEQASEGFAKGQTGSSAMPHKMNSRSCERINGFHTLLKGYLAMASQLIGDQWNEGDVSCSVVRRVMLPDSFLAVDGLFETTLTVLGQMVAFPFMISKENEYYLPFLMSTTFLMKAVQSGVGRETAHTLIKKHAIATVNDLRSGQCSQNNLLKRLEDEESLQFTKQNLKEMVEEGLKHQGAANNQVDSFIKNTNLLTKVNDDARMYRPSSIL